MTEKLYTEAASQLSEPIVVRLYNNARDYSEGGLASAADAVRNAGRMGDEILLHITPDEFEELQADWGPPTINPVTGLPEYGLRRLFKKAGKFVKKVVANPLVQAIAPIAMNMFLPGVGGLLAQAAFGAASAKVGGGNPLKGALMGGLGHVMGGGSVGAKGEGLLSKFMPGRGAAQAGKSIAGSVPYDMLGASGGLNAIDMSSLPGRLGGGLSQAISKPSFFENIKNIGHGGLGNIAQDAAGWFKDPETGAMRWGRVAGAGLGALALAQGMGGKEGGDAAPPQLPGSFNEPLPNLSFDRQQMPVQNYFTYGQAGGPQEGEASFFSNNAIPQGVNTGNSALDIGQANPAMTGVDPGAASSPGLPPGVNQQDLESIMRSMSMYQEGGEVESLADLRKIVGGQITEDEATRFEGHVRGAGSGRSDDIEAQLSDGEYVMDAETVALLGDGSTDEGARRLDEMRTNLRKHKAENLQKGEFSHDAKAPHDYLPGGARRKFKGGLNRVNRLESYLEANQGNKMAKGGEVSKGIQRAIASLRRLKPDSPVLQFFTGKKQEVPRPRTLTRPEARGDSPLGQSVIEEPDENTLPIPARGFRASLQDDEMVELMSQELQRLRGGEPWSPADASWEKFSRGNKR